MVVTPQHRKLTAPTVLTGLSTDELGRFRLAFRFSFALVRHTGTMNDVPPRRAGRRRRTGRLAAAAIALALVAAACGSGDEQAGTGALNEISASTFDAQATTVSGEPFDLGELADRDLVLWFWAPW